jgi:hypothetical protein
MIRSYHDPSSIASVQTPPALLKALWIIGDEVPVKRMAASQRREFVADRVNWGLTLGILAISLRLTDFGRR